MSASLEKAPLAEKGHKSAGLDLVRFIADHQITIQKYDPAQSSDENDPRNRIANGTNNVENPPSYEEIVIEALHEHIQSLTKQQAENIRRGVYDAPGDGKVHPKGTFETNSGALSQESDFFETEPSVSAEDVVKRLKAFVGEYKITSSTKSLDKAFLNILPETNQAFFYPYDPKSSSITEPILAIITAGTPSDNVNLFQIAGFDRSAPNSLLNIEFVPSETIDKKVTFHSVDSTDANAVKDINGEADEIPRTTALEFFVGTYKFTSSALREFGFTVTADNAVYWGKVEGGDLTSAGAEKVEVSIKKNSVSWVTKEKQVLTGRFKRSWDAKDKASQTTFEGTVRDKDSSTNSFTATLVTGDELPGWQKFLIGPYGVVSSNLVFAVRTLSYAVHWLPPYHALLSPITNEQC